jgi:hypothetical protein
MRKIKGTPLTYEDFNSEILPRLESVLQQSMDMVEEKFSKKLLATEEKVMGEIKDMREELTIALHQYKRTNARVDKIDEHLGINTLIDD